MAVKNEAVKLATASRTTAGRAGRKTSARATASGLQQKLAKLGLFNEADLLLHLPLRYENETRLTPLAAALQTCTTEPQLIDVEVISSEVSFRPRRQLLAQVRDAHQPDSSLLQVRLLNFYPSQQKQFAAGNRLRLFGEIRNGYFGAEMVHPRATLLTTGTTLATTLTPVYPTTAGLGQASLRRLIQKALDSQTLADTLPEHLRAGLPEFSSALRLLHDPPPSALGSAWLAAAWQRMRFDELLAQQLSLRLAYAQRREQQSPSLPLHPASDALRQKFLDQLPFQLTRAQNRAWQDIQQDMAAAHPMQRLLQGDVGSGKTVVAALCLLQAIAHGWQGAFMAPTEILAEQHYQKLSQWFAPLGIQIVWLAGRLKKSQKTAMLDALRTGQAQLAIGTHALIEDPVDFAQLAVAVIDEQHRFGVRQRLSLRQKTTAGVPHQLMMSATPIPRSLAMSYYADLDVSIIDELPPGRTPIATRVINENRRDEVITRVHAACQNGRQAYWVCPLIEESETLQLQTALDTHARLQADLPDLHVGLVHGRLKPAEKSAVMQAFANNEIQVLVATTVIEVGVDVPNASLMIIEHAERFGLAQLHQLRGRVGRGTAESACVLLYSPPLGEIARARLKVIHDHSDGFEIARQDLALRGPGEFIGARQSGLPLMRYADLNDSALVERARTIAETLLRDHPQAATAHLQRWLAGREELLKA